MNSANTMVSMICCGLSLAVAGCATPPRDYTAWGYSAPATISLISRTVTKDRNTFLFELRNVSDTPMEFIGEQFVDPDCVVQRKRSIGGWTELPDYMHYEDDSVLGFELASGQFTVFEVAFTGKLETPFEFRAGVRLAPRGDSSEGSAIPLYWSDTIKVEP